MSKATPMNLGTFVMQENGTFEVEVRDTTEAAKPARVLSDIRNIAEQRPKTRMRRITERRRAQNRAAQRSYREKQKRLQLIGNIGGSHGLSNIEATITLDPSKDQLQSPKAGTNTQAASNMLIEDSTDVGLLDHSSELWDWPTTIDPNQPYNCGFTLGNSLSNSRDPFSNITSTYSSVSVPSIGTGHFPDTISYHQSIENIAPHSYHPWVLASEPESTLSKDSSVLVTAPPNFRPASEGGSYTAKAKNAFYHLEAHSDDVNMPEPGFTVANYQPSDDAVYNSVRFSHHFN